MAFDFASLKFRTANLDSDGWGPGEGVNLTPVQVDENFEALGRGLEEVIASPTAPVEISNITASGAALTVHLSNGDTYGPFAFPTPGLNFRGEWLPETVYAQLDLFTAADSLYIVDHAHTSSVAPFNPADAGVEGAYARVIMPYPNVYAVGFFVPGPPGGGFTPGDTMAADLAPVDYYMPAGFAGSLAHLETPASDSAGLEFALFRGSTPIGTLSFAAGDPSGTFGALNGDPIQFTAGNRLRVAAPIGIDGAARTLTVKFFARKGTAS